MELLWNTARLVGELLFAPFAWMPPLAGVVTMSVVLGVVLLLAFRVLTPQVRLKRVKDLMSATIYEMRLYSAYPGHVVRAQGRAIVLTLRYLALALPSFVVLLPVVGVILLRAALLYEVAPLDVGERVLVKVAHGEGEVSVKAQGPGVRVVPPLVRLEGEAYVRVEAVKPGRHMLRIKVGPAEVDKRITVGQMGVLSLSPMRARAGDWELLLSDEERLSAGGPIRSITVAYREEGLTWLGLPWWLHLLIISMAVALALRRRLGVVF